MGLLAIAVAAGGGLSFVLSGFQADNASHTMATNFVLAFTFSFIEMSKQSPRSVTTLIAATDY